MAELRVIAAASSLVVLAVAASCRASEADSGSSLEPPAGWQAMPSLASAATSAAKENGIAVVRALAWGEPARGCYAAWLALRSDGGAPDVIARQIVESLSAEPALDGIVVRDVTEPEAGAATGVLALGFEREPYRGRLRMTLAKDGNLAALACFWNQREPVACERACITLVGGMP